MSDEEQVRELVTRWAEAVHDGDLATVLDRHAADIVMFDVPPPDDGVRGIDAYRETWPPFFEWQRSGATFTVLELDVAELTSYCTSSLHAQARYQPNQVATFLARELKIYSKLRPPSTDPVCT